MESSGGFGRVSAGEGLGGYVVLAREPHVAFSMAETRRLRDIDCAVRGLDHEDCMLCLRRLTSQTYANTIDRTDQPQRWCRACSHTTISHVA